MYPLIWPMTTVLHWIGLWIFTCTMSLFYVQLFRVYIKLAIASWEPKAYLHLPSNGAFRLIGLAVETKLSEAVLIHIPVCGCVCIAEKCTSNDGSWLCFQLITEARQITAQHRLAYCVELFTWLKMRWLGQGRVIHVVNQGKCPFETTRWKAQAVL